MRKSLIPILLAGALISLVACLSAVGGELPGLGGGDFGGGDDDRCFVGGCSTLYPFGHVPYGRGDDDRCFVGGCSGQLCTDRQDIVSTCEWLEEYACYRTATCESQADGSCGWTPTPELRACLVQAAAAAP